ncbi:uncharacterized protein LOC141651377 [Silene latifolia]|uniref:uncharacterized protein LOC141651377 n=1 Tax=Silene latifolia TaxID=37657 RepID=UPI003D76F080
MNELPQKLEDPGSFSITCAIGTVRIERALFDLGSSINLMPLKIFKKLEDFELSPHRVSLELGDRSVRYPINLVEEVPLNMGKLVIPCDFYVMDISEDTKIPIILGRPCLVTGGGGGGALIDVKSRKLSLQVGEDKMEFSLNNTLNEPSKGKTCYMVDVLEECIEEKQVEGDNSLQGFLEGKIKDCKEHKEYALAMESTILEDSNKEFESLRKDGKK